MKMLSKKFIETYKNKVPPWGPVGYIVYKRTYSRFISELGRMEEWYETCERVCNALLNYSNVFTIKEMERLYDFIFNLKGTVSGRALWQLGTITVEKIGADSLQNCWLIKINDIESFCFAFNQLMLGGGVGFNVQPKYVYELPIIKHNVEIKRIENPDCDFIVPDNREGWIELLRKIFQAFYQTGKDFYYSTQLIRSAGKPIRSFGGTASGSEALVIGLDNIVKIIKSRHLSKLRPIDCVDIMNIIGQIVVSGNVRRSSEIAIGDVQDTQFLRAKNWVKNKVPNWRSMSNNSIVCSEYSRLNSIFWESYQGEGEPCGLINLANCRNFGRLIDGYHYRQDPGVIGTNPCGEITLHHKEPCILAEIFLPNLKDINEFKEIATLLFKACKVIINLPFSDPETEAIVKENQRTGISLTGYWQCPWIREAEILDSGYRTLEDFDIDYSGKWGCNRSIKLTTVKPSGTLSLLAGVTPGIHAAFAQCMIRRIRFSSNDPLVEICRKHNYNVEPQICLDGSHDSKIMVVDFPIKMPPNTITEDQLSIIQKLETQKFIQTYWSDNSISVTHYYRPEELNTIKEWLEKNYNESVKTMTFFLASDHGFAQAPLEKISEERYEEMASRIMPITSIVNDDETMDYYTDLECGNHCPVR